MSAATGPGPEYNPTALVVEVMELLGRKGIRTSAGPRATRAVHAAADLLRALGVTPASAPMAPRRPRAHR